MVLQLWIEWANITDCTSMAVHAGLLQWYVDTRTDTDDPTYISLLVYDTTNGTAQRDRVGRLHLSVDRVRSRPLVK